MSNPSRMLGFDGSGEQRRSRIPARAQVYAGELFQNLRCAFAQFSLALEPLPYGRVGKRKRRSRRGDFRRRLRRGEQRLPGIDDVVEVQLPHDTQELPFRLTSAADYAEPFAQWRLIRPR